MDRKGLDAVNEIIEEVVTELQKFQIEVRAPIMSLDQFKLILADILNQLITDNFSRLISVLYRLDISEKRLKQLLKGETNASAGDIIAEMIIERQAEKIKTRKLFSGTDNCGCNEEKW